MKKDRSDRIIGLAFAITMVAAVSTGIVYILGGQTQLEGLFFGIALGGFGVGLILWAKHLLPGGHDTQDRVSLVPTDEEEEAAEKSLKRGVDLLERRSFLVKMAVAAMGALGLAAIFPIRSLGSGHPSEELLEPSWSDGVPVVDSEGRRVEAAEVGVGQVLTVFPEGAVGSASAVTLVIGLPAEVDVPLPGREGWAAGDVVAYSKICTHVGCPVGLYKPQSHQLFCPCHQSVFDVANAARPTGGPATRALPQLPIGVDGDGFLIARGDFSEIPGPGFWSRPRHD